MLDTGKHPWLGVEPLRDSHLETLNDFTSRMGMAMDEAYSALTQAANTWPNSMMPIVEKHHCMRLGIRYGLMVRT